MKDALDVNFGIQKDEGAKTETKNRQQQTKRILEGFGVELDSLVIENIDDLARRMETVFDSHYDEDYVDQQC